MKGTLSAPSGGGAPFNPWFTLITAIGKGGKGRGEGSHHHAGILRQYTKHYRRLFTISLHHLVNYNSPAGDITEKEGEKKGRKGGKRGRINRIYQPAAAEGISVSSASFDFRAAGLLALKKKERRKGGRGGEENNDNVEVVVLNYFLDRYYVTRNLGREKKGKEGERQEREKKKGRTRKREEILAVAQGAPALAPQNYLLFPS